MEGIVIAFNVYSCCSQSQKTISAFNQKIVSRNQERSFNFKVVKICVQPKIVSRNSRKDRKEFYF